ncbi:hypothetical protein VPH35_094523 [Triticum aestivum]
MLRSFITRSQPFLSHLRRRAAAKPRVLPSRAYATEDGTARLDGPDRTTAAAANLRRHLYTLSTSSTSTTSMATAMATRTQAPWTRRPALRLGVSLVSTFEGRRFKALGDNIVITGHSDTMSRDGAFFLTLVFDTKTGKLDDAGSPPYDPEPVDGDDYPEPARDWWPRGSYQVAPAGDKLWALDATDNTPGYLACEERYHQLEWVWNIGYRPFELLLRSPTDATGYDNHVKSHAVHPDGRTIFASSSFTFSLDADGCYRGYYDGDLDAWVGIRVADGADGRSKGHPYLCSCDVPKLVDAEGPVQEPARKMCDEELTSLKTPVSPGCRTLVHTGRGRFCVVDVVPATVAKQGAEPRCSTDDNIEYLLHVTMFRAKHCKNGDLVVTPCRPGRSYLVPNCSVCLPGAFWM